ncbi:hypothetical protein K505DRAFT_389327 [Melanomma pulvis-pyrius CBS 109.77]|uniref:Uncharacterized protein n=1 Tax=Melanomma pulvis-pyrius CBS 109.77 TaxID=1314802 RepID=A0A6A6X5U5_9PLEO|nr:hypothetical protein K505DRAFT_389327 [Melanomma pulvis-pyrius CBS 109.77]
MPSHEPHSPLRHSYPSIPTTTTQVPPQATPQRHQPPASPASYHQASAALAQSANNSPRNKQQNPPSQRVRNPDKNADKTHEPLPTAPASEQQDTSLSLLPTHARTRARTRTPNPPRRPSAPTALPNHRTNVPPQPHPSPQPARDTAKKPPRLNPSHEVTHQDPATADTPSQTQPQPQAQQTPPTDSTPLIQRPPSTPPTCHPQTQEGSAEYVRRQAQVKRRSFDFNERRRPTPRPWPPCPWPPCPSTPPSFHPCSLLPSFPFSIPLLHFPLQTNTQRGAEPLSLRSPILARREGLLVRSCVARGGELSG